MPATDRVRERSRILRNRTSRCRRGDTGRRIGLRAPGTHSGVSLPAGAHQIHTTGAAGGDGGPLDDDSDLIGFDRRFSLRIGGSATKLNQRRQPGSFVLFSTTAQGRSLLAALRLQAWLPTDDVHAGKEAAALGRTPRFRDGPVVGFDVHLPSFVEELAPEFQRPLLAGR